MIFLYRWACRQLPFSYIIFGVLVVAGGAEASFMAKHSGLATVTVALAPIRVSLWEGRILKAITRGTTIEVTAVQGSSAGKFYHVEIVIDGRKIKGWLDSRQVDFEGDTKARAGENR